MVKKQGYSNLYSIAPKEVHNDLVVSWNETEEALTSLKELNDHDLIQNKDAIIKRLENVIYWLGKYVSEDDVLFENLK